ncbi:MULTISPECIES: hypothetical protein [unclassified Streptomyces]|nr:MULTISPECIES: hypothetical protein [unclassified Streptomyces]MYS19900.1 hypothetical protein [Streptomyces sp. SID4948]
MYDPPYAARFWLPGDPAPLTLTPFPPGRSFSPCAGHVKVIPFGVAG